jgi:hypothetical protein
MTFTGGELTFDGGNPNGLSDEVFIIQLAKTLTVSPRTKMILIGGAQVKNIFWAVSESVSLGENSVFKGVLSSATKVILKATASLDGRIFAGTAVTLIANRIN